MGMVRGRRGDGYGVVEECERSGSGVGGSGDGRGAETSRHCMTE